MMKNGGLGIIVLSAFDQTLLSVGGGVCVGMGDVLSDRS